MSPVHLFELLLLLMALIIPLEMGARRLGLPPAAALILGGMVLALLPGRYDIQLDPDLTLVLFLPPLLLSSAYFTVWRDFRADLRIILQLAVGAVVFTTLVVGAIAHWVLPSLPWAACFALGAIVSPPDAVATKAVLQRVALPPRLVLLLEGESLVNDASSLVLFRLAVAAALTGTFSAGHAVASFALLSVGGVAVGTVFGHVVSRLFGGLRDVHLAIVGSLLAAWASYIAGEAVGVSGVLSTVACGLVLGWRQHEVLSAVARTHARVVWELVVFVLESMVFILIGLSLRGVLQRMGDTSETLATVLPAIVAVVAAVVLTRFAWIFPNVYIPRLLFPGLRRRDPIPPVAVPIIMSWAGMRGVVSLAAALSLPQQMPGRDFILVTTFIVILVTVIGQGATLAPLIRALRLGGFTQVPRRTIPEAEARVRMAREQLAAIERQARGADGTVLHPRLLEQYEYRARVAQRFSEADGALTGARDAHFSVILAAVAAGRTELLRLHRSGLIHDTVLHALEQELDLEEMSARRRRGEVLG